MFPMSQGSSGSGSPGPAAGQVPLMGCLPHEPLTPQQQLEAARRVQAQAEHRLQLSTQFFKAAEARVAGQQAQLDQIKAEQDALRERLEQDVTRTLHAYDQWVGRMDENFTRTIRELEQRVDKLQEQWAVTQARLDRMMQRSAQMLEQSRALLARSTPPQAAVRMTSPAMSDPQGDGVDAVTSEELSIYQTLLRRMQDEADGGQRDAAA